MRGANDPTYRQVTWVGPTAASTITGLKPGELVAVAVASSDDLGHTSLFGPEATWQVK